MWRDADPIANAVNANGKFLMDLMGNLDPAGTANAVGNNPSFLKGLLGYLDLDKLNALMSRTWTWTSCPTFNISLG